MHLFSAPQPVAIGQAGLAGEFALPEHAQRVALIVHPDRASRMAGGQRFVADVLRANGVATLSVGLLTPGEDRRGAGLPAPDVVASRLRAMLAWLARHVDAQPLQVGLVVVGAAVPACLAASRARGLDAIRAIVMVDGQPDLSRAAVRGWRWPGVAIVGHNESLARPRGRPRGSAAVPAPHRVARLAGQTFPFAEPGAFEAIACETTAWLRRCLPQALPRAPAAPAARAPGSAHGPVPWPAHASSAARRTGAPGALPAWLPPPH